MSNFDPFAPTYMGFSKIWNRLDRPSLEDTALNQVLQNHPPVWGLNTLDSRVQLLLEGGFDLTDAGSSFFKPQQTWREWDKGVSEIGVLAAWQHNGILRATAYPPQLVNTTAPFDAHLDLLGIDVAGDIKTATTAASGAILETIGPSLEMWAQGNKRGTPEIELHIEGGLDLRRLARNWHEIRRQFNDGLASNNPNQFLISVRCPLPNDPNDPAGAGDLRIEVNLLPPGESPDHTWNRLALYEDLAGNPRDPAVEFAQSLVEDHAAKKGKHSDPAGMKPAFVLAYHRSMKSGDLRPEHVAAAMRLAAGPGNWMGVLYVDELHAPAVKTFHLHRNATLPSGLDAEALRLEMER